MMKHLNKISLGLTLMVIVYLGYKEFSSKDGKMAVIQMEQLVYEYQGMKDATKDYQKRLDSWSAQSDSLEQKLNTLYQELQLDSINGDQEKLRKDQQQFYYLQKSYYEYQEKISQKAQEDDQEMTVGVLNQLKEHVKKYAMMKEYDIIIANTQLDNVSYVNQEKDVTQELLSYANDSYNGE